MTAADLSDRQEEVLSYLQGLAPVGEPFEFTITQVSGDLGPHANTVSSAVRALRTKGFIEMIGRVGWHFEYRVLKRLEERGSKHETTIGSS